MCLEIESVLFVGWENIEMFKRHVIVEYAIIFKIAEGVIRL